MTSPMMGCMINSFDLVFRALGLGFQASGLRFRVMVQRGRGKEEWLRMLEIGRSCPSAEGL